MIDSDLVTVLATVALVTSEVLPLMEFTSVNGVLHGIFMIVAKVARKMLNKQE